MWWQDLLWGGWNGFTAWIVWLAHILGFWEQYPFFNAARDGGWYEFGFLIGVGAWGAGPASARRRRG